MADWNEYDMEGECDVCGKQAKLVKAGDPFIDEVYPEEKNDPLYWCYDCFTERQGDV